MKKITVIITLLFVCLVGYAQSPIQSLGLVFGLTKEDAIVRLRERNISFDTTRKDVIAINQHVESAGSQFDRCTLIFKKDKLTEANFVQDYSKSDERIVSIKFSAISRSLSEVYLLRRYMEKSQDGYYNGWKSDTNGYAKLTYSKQDNGTSSLNLTYSTKGLF